MCQTIDGPFDTSTDRVWPSTGPRAKRAGIGRKSELVAIAYELRDLAACLTKMGFVTESLSETGDGEGYYGLSLLVVRVTSFSESPFGGGDAGKSGRTDCCQAQTMQL